MTNNKVERIESFLYFNVLLNAIGLQNIAPRILPELSLFKKKNKSIRVLERHGKFFIKYIFIERQKRLKS